MNILNILNDIASDTKRSHKISILEKNKDNKLLMKVIFLALDPYTNFYIKIIPQYTPSSNKSLEWALFELEKLSSRELTGNNGINHLKMILSSLSKDDATVIERIIGKDLRAGLAEGIVNAVVKDFIKTYPCLLAKDFDQSSIKNIQWPAIAQEKSDGGRVNIHVDGNNVVICGRSGRAIDLLGHIDNDMILLGQQFDYPVVFDGELLVKNEFGTMDRRTGNGIMNKAIKGTISEEEAAAVYIQLWDVIPKSEFVKEKSINSYDIRFNLLSNAINSVKSDKYFLIPNIIVNNLNEATEYFNEMLKNKKEGIILKNLKNNPWENKRSKNMLKFKAVLEADMQIIGYKNGEGKFKDQVGSIVVASSDRKVEVNISGFPDDVRLDITSRKNELLNTIVSVKYNERIKSKEKGRDGIDSLFLPRFNEFRSDKTVANSSDEIK